jgi:hypothetical protein
MGAWIMAIADTAYGDMVAQTKKKAVPTPPVNSSLVNKATKIMEADTAKTDAYQAALTAPAKTQAEVDAINAGVKQVTESTGNVYDPSKAMTVANQTSINPAVVSANKPKTSVDEDAFGRLMNILNQWNLGSLSSVIRQLLTEGLSYDSVLTKIKYDSGKNPATGEAYNAAYTLRFAGNKARLDRGLNALTEEQYLSNENSYAETLKAYGLTNMLSLDRTTNEAKFAQYIANDLAPTEFRDRIDLAATRVINMDPAIKKNFMEYYPEVSKSDLISYFLAPDETLPLLKTKINAAEIGAAAGYQGLGIGVGRAEELAKFGETYDQAKTDYSKVAEVLPTGQKLSNIYGEEGIAYTQATAEDEYIKQDAAAKLKRNRLASKERAMFEGSNNISLDRSYQGKF